MNRLVFLAVFGLATVAMVCARGDRRGGGSRDGDRYGECDQNSRFGRRLFRRCACSTQCTGNNGTNNFYCGSQTTYIQCQDTACSVQACPANNLFNCTSRQCQPCPTGFHVDAYQTKCVCNQGTTFNRTTQTCTQCPINSIQTVDSCYCSASALSKPDNTCKACPTGSTLTTNLQCRCNDAKTYWSQNDFACKQCPGAWVNRTSTDRHRGSSVDQVCQCQGTNQVFNKYQVACVTCPANSVQVRPNRYPYETTCQCTLATQKYDCETNTCVDRAADSSSSNDSGERH